MEEVFRFILNGAVVVIVVWVLVYLGSQAGWFVRRSKLVRTVTGARNVEEQWNPKRSHVISWREVFITMAGVTSVLFIYGLLGDSVPDTIRPNVFPITIVGTAIVLWGLMARRYKGAEMPKTDLILVAFVLSVGMFVAAYLVVGLLIFD